MDLAVVAAGVGLKVEFANIGASVAIIAQVVRQDGHIFRDGYPHMRYAEGRWILTAEKR